MVYLSIQMEVGPPTLVAQGELAREVGVAQVQLTWGATIVQSLANSTCPERAKMMTLRKEVNHITHSKSATSWGRPGQLRRGSGAGWAGTLAEQSPSTSPTSVFLCIRGQPWLEALAFSSGGSTSQVGREK